MATAMSSVATASAGAAGLTGAGSTLVKPLVEEWGKAFSAKTGITVTYGGGGSSAGIAAIIGRTQSFGASDAPFTASQAAECNGCDEIPWALTATAVGFHLEGVETLRLTGPVLAEIFEGKIVNWDASALVKLNPSESLPNLPITTVHRSDGSGDTYAFTNYLSKVSSGWKSKYGFSTSIEFPGGIGAKGNAGVSAVLKSTNGSIGYVSASYLIENQLNGAAIKNAAGKFEYPNLKNIIAAAATIKKVPANEELHIVDPPKGAKKAYPISTFSYVLVPKVTAIKAELVQFIEYAIGPGQAFGAAKDFAPLPSVVLKADKAALKKLAA
jgi:phosphate transport system substrate-binding protein